MVIFWGLMAAGLLRTVCAAGLLRTACCAAGLLRTVCAAAGFLRILCVVARVRAIAGLLRTGLVGGMGVQRALRDTHGS